MDFFLTLPHYLHITSAEKYAGRVRGRGSRGRTAARKGFIIVEGGRAGEVPLSTVWQITRGGSGRYLVEPAQWRRVSVILYGERREGKLAVYSGVEKEQRS